MSRKIETKRHKIQASMQRDSTQNHHCDQHG